ncbi:MAG: hypothetical protein ACI4OT_00040 [Bacilli bacterium]
MKSNCLNFLNELECVKNNKSLLESLFYLFDTKQDILGFSLNNKMKPYEVKKNKKDEFVYKANNGTILKLKDFNDGSYKIDYLYKDPNDNSTNVINFFKLRDYNSVYYIYRHRVLDKELLEHISIIDDDIINKFSYDYDKINHMEVDLTKTMDFLPDTDNIYKLFPGSNSCLSKCNVIYHHEDEFHVSLPFNYCILEVFEKITPLFDQELTPLYVRTKMLKQN